MPVMSEPWNFGAAGPQAATASTSSAATFKRTKPIRGPLNKSRTVATAAFRDGMREARRSQWQAPLASLAKTSVSVEANVSVANVKPCAAAAGATKQTARKAPSLWVAAKCGACFVALLGIIVQATTFVARLAFIRILPATQSAWDLFRGSLANNGREGVPKTAPRDRGWKNGKCAGPARRCSVGRARAHDRGTWRRAPPLRPNTARRSCESRTEAR